MPPGGASMPRFAAGSKSPPYGGRYRFEGSRRAAFHMPPGRGPMPRFAAGNKSPPYETPPPTVRDGAARSGCRLRSLAPPRPCGAATVLGEGTGYGLTELGTRPGERPGRCSGRPVRSCRESPIGRRPGRRSNRRRGTRLEPDDGPVGSVTAPDG